MGASAVQAHNVGAAVTESGVEKQQLRLREAESALWEARRLLEGVDRELAAVAGVGSPAGSQSAEWVYRVNAGYLVAYAAMTQALGLVDGLGEIIGTGVGRAVVLRESRQLREIFQRVTLVWGLHASLALHDHLAEQVVSH